MIQLGDGAGPCEQNEIVRCHTISPYTSKWLSKLVVSNAQNGVRHCLIQYTWMSSTSLPGLAGKRITANLTDIDQSKQGIASFANAQSALPWSSSLAHIALVLLSVSSAEITPFN